MEGQAQYEPIGDGASERTRLSGASRDRTGDLRVANAALCQLSYGPALGSLGGSGAKGLASVG